MASFELFKSKILAIEGGYQNNENDKGNYNSKGKLVGTKYGISAPVYERYIGRVPSVLDMQIITKEIALDIYRKNYWNRNRLSEFNSQDLAEIVCDAAINHGSGSRKKTGGVTMLQEVLNLFGESLAVDGVIGTLTLVATNNVDKNSPVELYNSYRDRRIQRYHEIVANDPTQSVFLNGWLNRMDDYPEKNVLEEAYSVKTTTYDGPFQRTASTIYHFFKGILSVRNSPGAQREWVIIVVITTLLVVFLVLKRKGFLNIKSAQ